LVELTRDEFLTAKARLLTSGYRFTRPWGCTVREIHTPDGRMCVSDRDKGPDGKVRYYLVSEHHPEDAYAADR